MVNRAIFSPTVNRFPIRASMRVSIRRRIASNTRVVCFSGPPLDGPGSPNSDNATPPSTPSQPNSPVQLRLGHVPKLALPLAYLAARLAWKPNLLPELGDAASILLAYGSKQVLELSQKFDLQTASELQDLVNCLVLSECVYKCVGRPEEEAFLAMSELKSRFPPGLVTIRHAQFSNTHTAHRFMLAESGEAFYVALMGTKYRKDYFTNVQAFDEMFPALESQGGESSVYAHRGYLQRANSVPVAALNKEAQHRGKRLVFCGYVGLFCVFVCFCSIVSFTDYSSHHGVQTFSWRGCCSFVYDSSSVCFKKL